MIAEGGMQSAQSPQSPLNGGAHAERKHMPKQQITLPDGMSRPGRRATPARATWYAFLGLAIVFALCVAVQVFIAGLATFVTPSHWAQHTMFVHIFEFVPLLMLVVSAAGRLPARLRWLSAALFLLVFAQYMTANLRGLAPLVAALHPVVALAIFWLALHVVLEARRAMVMPARL
jgi:putative tricarboxylic transport membrane protein